ncbi:hypothetical protein CAPTEDRAFT_198628 [Capitella teleta]|uniref:Paraoxonase n=1 Tax=Capitella teleta TaxID=283909 RepID=R7UYV6_CAPTE|nr:hypothetical protein CAPTEDRAFT_198628 [Capitella teleta]|eukprot:ELU11753.1 hypothetical protein CAPTEDRAFT_198628 [Capitella teleta]
MQRSLLFRMGIVVKSVLFGMFVIVAFRLWQIAPMLAIGRTVYHHSPGHCRLVEGIENGAEDIATLPNGLAFFSSGLDFPAGHLKYPVTGKIYTFDFNHPGSSFVIVYTNIAIIIKILDENPKELTIEGLSSMNPHGLSLWQNDKGDTYLFVVNHPPNGEECVDKFLFDAKTNSLVHKMRVSSTEHGFMEVVNDLVVVGDNQFYYTNFLHKQLPVAVQKFGMIAWGSVGYFDGQKTSLVQKGLLLPNGINISPDMKYVYVSHSGHAEILVLNRLSDGSLSLKNSIQIGTRGDNLDVDPITGSIWIGAHPKFMQIVRYASDPNTYKSASQVLRVNMKDGHFVNMTEVFADDGSFISGSSSAVYYKHAMLVGTVFTNLMYCEVK